ncbi:uncharacterized protein LOC118690237 [Molothrus ater]|uniref:uncharacterized protein LOC118690237 n=1 Tax=Molothrus ater TaxID=84834 RepID=UPI00174B0B3D|nr:uncharacterized protein LOC118690237 [Molothrus ater]
MGRSGRGSAGVFSPGPGHERGPDEGTGEGLASGTHGARGPFGQPRLRPTLPRAAASRLPRLPIPARLSPPALSNHSLSIRALSRQSDRSVAARPLSLAPLPRTPEAPLPPRRFGSRRNCVPAAAASAGAVGAGKGGPGASFSSGVSSAAELERREVWLRDRRSGAVGATGAADARSEERRCARTGPQWQLIRGALVSTEATPAAAFGSRLCPVLSAAPCAARVAGGWCGAWSGAGGEPAAVTGGREEAVSRFLDLKYCSEYEE